MMSTTFRRGAGAVVAGLVVTAGGMAAHADTHTPNQPGYWEQVLMDPEGDYADHGFTNVDCEKVADDYSDETWTADQDYIAVILNAGSEQSTDDPDDVHLYVATGTELSHESGKEISHVIACTGDVPEEPTDEPEEPTDEPEEPTDEPEEPTDEPEQPGTPGDGDDAGEPIGPIVQTDVPAKGVNPALPLAAVAAAGLGLAGLGLRRRGQEH